MENNLSQEVLEKIEKKHLSPKPKWEFALREYFIWAIFGMAVIVGGLATSVVIFMLDHGGWERELGFGTVRAIFLGLPYFWLLTLAVLVVIAVYDFKHTKRGYRFPPTLVVTTSVLFSVILGSVIYAVGGGEKIEGLIYRRLPIYMQIMHWQGRPYVASEAGRLAGVVIVARPVERFQIRDFKGKVWFVICEQPAESNCNIIRDGLRVRMIGEKVSGTEFRVDFVKEFLGRGMMPPTLRRDMRLKDRMPPPR